MLKGAVPPVHEVRTDTTADCPWSNVLSDSAPSVRDGVVLTVTTAAPEYTVTGVLELSTTCSWYFHVPVFAGLVV